MRDNKVLESFKKKIEKNLKEMNIFKENKWENGDNPIQTHN